MTTTLGTCSLCGGRVSVPSAWYGTVPPIPQCESCGATKKYPHGQVIEMEKRNYNNHNFNEVCVFCGGRHGRGMPCDKVTFTTAGNMEDKTDVWKG